MARLNVLEYKADFVRGWPLGAAVEMNYPSDAAFGNGDIVEVSAGGKVVAATDDTVTPAIVARGSNDSATNGGTGNLQQTSVPNICVFSGFVVRTSVVNATGLTVGAQVGVIGGKWDVAATVKVATILELEAGTVDGSGNAVTSAVILVK